ncbi:MAG: hypothetical protein ACRC0X_08170 [Brevinema sp.]
MILLLLLMFVVPVYSIVGTNNMTINLGGVFNYSQIVINDDSTKRSERLSDYIGGGFNLEIGYLYLSQDSVIHAIDTRIGFGVNLDNPHTGELIGLSEIKFNTLHFYIGTTYGIGQIVGYGRILVDILGLNFGFFTANLIVSEQVDDEKVHFISRMGNNFLLSLNLPLGIQYIFNNGLMLGFRHRLDFAFSKLYTGFKSTVRDTITTSIPQDGGVFGLSKFQDSYLGYNMNFSIGYVFGK